jgi:outer membrane receptor protein involved in Fe transport
MRFSFAALAAAIWFSIAIPAHAGTLGFVRGTVQRDGAPVAGVRVTLAGESVNLRALSDERGQFSFPSVRFGTFVASATDGDLSASSDLEVYSNSVVHVTLELRRLKVIGETATATTRGVASSPVSVNTLGAQQIAANPQNQSLNRLIETFPGVVRFSYNEPVVHGFHGVTYELDGVPLPQSTTSNFSEVMDPRSIDSREGCTGSCPAEYGGARQGGVVNIITRRPVDLTAPNEGFLTVGAGTYGSAEYSLGDAFRAGNTRVFLNLNAQRTNRGIDSPTFDPIHDSANQSNQFLRSITNLGTSDTLSFNFSRNYAAFQIPINIDYNPNDPLLVPAATDDVQREYDNLISLTYTVNGRDGKSYTQISPWYSYNRVVYAGDLPNDLLGTIDFQPYSGSGLIQDFGSTFQGLRLSHFHVFGDNAVKGGVDSFLENFKGNETIAYYGQDQNGSYSPPPLAFYQNSAQKGSQFSAYVEDKWTPTGYLSVNAGLRYDHSTGYVGGSQLSPRLEVNAQPDARDIVHGYWGRLYAAPFLEDERLAAIIIGGGNPNDIPAYDLQPERDWYYEFGLAHTFSDRSRGTINFWKRNVTNVLDTTQLANTPVFSVFNNTIGIAKGVEARLDTKWQDGDTFFLSALLASSEAGGISGGTFLFCPTSDPGCLASSSDVTLQPEDHDQAFNFTMGYTKRLGSDGSYFASLMPGYGTGFPVQFQNGPARLAPHLTFDASFGRDPRRGARKSPGFTATFTNFTNSVYLLKVNNGFNTTQWGEGFYAGLRVTQPF